MYFIVTSYYLCICFIITHVITHKVTADSNNKLLPFPLLQKCGRRKISNSVLFTYK